LSFETVISLYTAEGLLLNPAWSQCVFDHFFPLLQDSDAEVVSCLTEKLRVANELLGASQKDYNELQKGNSKLKFELSWCKTQVKNAEKLKEVILYNY
jgi:hypothetical protein